MKACSTMNLTLAETLPKTILLPEVFGHIENPLGLPNSKAVVKWANSCMKVPGRKTND